MDKYRKYSKEREYLAHFRPKNMLTGRISDDSKDEILRRERAY
jgi:hypothetical protein